MGTSGAYGGTPGWEGVAQQTQDWVSAGGAGVGGGPSDSPKEANTASADSQSPSEAVAAVLGALGAAFSGGASSGRARARSRRRSDARSTTARNRRDVGQAAVVGGRAVSGSYGLRSGLAAPLEDLGLDLGALAALPLHEKARRLVDAASPPSGDVNESELRVVNANVILWALTEEVGPTPLELANRWIVEYAWSVWITESGPVLTKHTAEAYDRAQAEAEMRAALEARVVAHGLPEGRPLSSNDFSTAIAGALDALGRIGGEQ